MGFAGNDKKLIVLPTTNTPLIPSKKKVIPELPGVGSGLLVGVGVLVEVGTTVVGTGADVAVGTHVTPGVVVSQIGPNVCAYAFVRLKKNTKTPKKPNTAVFFSIMNLL